MQIKTRNRRAVTTVGILSLVGILAIGMFAANLNTQSAAANTPANKVGVSADTMTIQAAGAQEDSLLVVTFAKGSNTDAIVTFDEECSLFTTATIKNNGNKQGSQVGSATASQTVYLVVDGVPLPDTEVTMCEREHTITTNILSQIQELCSDVDDLQNATGTDDGEECDPSSFSSYIGTKAAHGWNWLLLEDDFAADGNTHTVEVVSKISGVTADSNNDGNSEWAAAVGKVSLIIDPENLANGS